MGRKAKWFAIVKKALYRESKRKKDQETKRARKKWRFGKSKHVEASGSTVEAGNELEHDQVYSVALASAAAAEAAAAAAQAAAEVVRITTATRNPSRSREEAAAIKIQTAFRGYLARRALRCLRGLARMKVRMEGSVNQQTRATLQKVRTYNKLQSQIRSRRILNHDNTNQAIQRRLHLEREKASKVLVGEDWNGSNQSKQQVETKLLQWEEAAIRRERTLAYALSHQQQWKKHNRSVHSMFTDQSNPHWGWSWLERWMAARSGDAPTSIDKDFNDSQSSIKSAPRSPMREVHRSYALRALNIDKPYSPKSSKLNTPLRQGSPSSPLSKTSISGKSKALSQRVGMRVEEDDARSVKSLQTEKYRRQKVAGSPARDGESQASSPPVPSYLASTASTRAKSRLPSSPDKRIETPDRRPMDSPKKRLPFQPSPGRPSSSGSSKPGSSHELNLENIRNK